jgi:hypothetical protein
VVPALTVNRTLAILRDPKPIRVHIRAVVSNEAEAVFVNEVVG